MAEPSQQPEIGDDDIAVVGMAAHLPGAPDIFAYWENLKDGISSIRPISQTDLQTSGESPERLRNPNYVAVAAGLEGFDQFDAEFFGFSPKEAAIIDPQHRQFLEVAWEALENAGHPPEGFAGKVGVFAGCGMGSYFYFNLCSNRDLVEQTGMFLLRHTGNDKDFLATRVSHIFDLRGPSINLQTACSTSLVAVHYAAQALLLGDCDMALAGGVTIELPQGRGYVYTEGEILSPDGECHAFDHRAQGTVFGSGAGCVVLRRAKDAIRDGDHIWAILKGSAVNNDGAAKAGYLAPSVEGQARCVADALKNAGVQAGSVSYVECHGTGTFLGDPIEVAALTSAFRESTAAVASCRIGSVKTNIGHLDTAAGVASLIKVALSLHHRQLPASLGFEAPNPVIDFANSPFTVNDHLTEWQADRPLVAGVNSLGVGGTNAHAVLQEAPVQAVSEESPWPFQPIIISARSRTALDQAAQRLATHLRAHPEQPLADVAYTLKEGRRAFEKRRVIVAANHQEAAALLDGADPARVFNHDHAGENPEVVFMFPGGGAQYAGMARGLYATEPVFADWMDRGLAVLQKTSGEDVRALWLPQPNQTDAANAALLRPSLQLPLIMIVEYALAQLYDSWGVRPAVLVGHSMGENTAACLAGVMSFEDCIGLVYLRGQLFDSLPAGGMLSAPLPEADLRPLLGDALDLASVNAPGLCVVSGPTEALAALSARLAHDGVDAHRIAIQVAAHSRMLDPILETFGKFLQGIALRAPRLPIISNLTGVALTPEQATDPAYWQAQLRNAVQFRACMQTLVAEPRRVFVEMGPGRALSSLAQVNGVKAERLVPSLRHRDHATADDAWHMATIARLWACGVDVDWAQIWGGARRNRVVLPGYPFQRQRYFIEPAANTAVREDTPVRLDDISTWGWEPHWRPTSAGIDLQTDFADAARQTWLIFADELGLAAAVTTRLRDAGHIVFTVRAGDRFARLGDFAYTLAPERGRDDYDLLVNDLAQRGSLPSRIAHFWLTTRQESHRPGSSFMHRNLEQGFYSLLFLSQALSGETLPDQVQLTVFTSGAAEVHAEGLTYPERACIIGPVRVLPREIPGMTASTLDIQLPERRQLAEFKALEDQVLEEMLAEPSSAVAALRGGRRFEQGLRAVAVAQADAKLPNGSHVLITGGFGGIGLTLAEDMIRRAQARITIVARHGLPPRAAWDNMLTSQDQSSPVCRRILAVRHLEQLGGEVFVATADVCNLADMTAALRQAEAAFGPVRMVIHAAGVVDDAPLATKSSAEVEAVLAAKLYGTQVLDRLFPDGALETLVLFASTSTVMGPAGQIDYVAANEYLNAYAKHRRHGRTKVLALNWGIWANVGMAAEAVAQRANVGARDLPRQRLEAPLLDEVSRDGPGNRTFFAELGVDRWALDGHRTVSGQALLPGTGIIEIAAEAVRACNETDSFEIRDLYFLRALDVSDGAKRRIEARLIRAEKGYGFELKSSAIKNGRETWELNAQARLIPIAAQNELLDLSAIAARMPEASRLQDWKNPQAAHLRFGPRWNVMTSASLAASEGVARLALAPEFAAEAATWQLHPALLDIATGWALPLIPGYSPDRLWVPVSYAQIRILAQLPAEIIAWVRLVQASNGTEARFDITLAAPDGTVCVDITGFSMHRIERDFALSKTDARSPGQDDRQHPVIGADTQLADKVALGIRAEEGAMAFRRALGMGGSQLYLSSLDLPALIRQVDQASGATETMGFARPDLDASYLAPRNAVESKLAEFWQELLGVAQVGVDDSFFDLGGHSLIAVRLFAKVKKEFGVDLPISTLINAPTIAQCAAQITPPAPDKAGSDDRRNAERYQHLVPMHAASVPDRSPFFLVAGMFGNVLNLRHLAHLIGENRPFYGLQARGLFGEAAPHDSFPKAAADYIAEMKQVQPRGPYLLGGFSGGGLIAWEIARQLEAAGDLVSILVLLDTPLPMRPALQRRDKTMIKLAEFRRKGPRYLREWIRSRWNWERQKRQTAVDPKSPTQFHNAAIEAAFRTASAAYTLPTRHGRTILFRPPLDMFWRVSKGNWVSKAKEYVFPDNDLTQFAPDLTVIEVPGDHDSMVLEPNVRVLAARLAEVIAKADSVPGDPPLAMAAE